MLGLRNTEECSLTYRQSKMYNRAKCLKNLSVHLDEILYVLPAYTLAHLGVVTEALIGVGVRCIFIC